MYQNIVTHYVSIYLVKSLNSWINNTLEPHNYDPRDYDLLAIMTWNLCGKYCPLTAMLIWLVIMNVYIDFWQLLLENEQNIDFFSNYDLKTSKIGSNLYNF